jgi:DNA invertase Pin-like site-specific DNA recombinase
MGTIQQRKTIGYARVSTTKQSDGWGIAAQLQRLDLYAKGRQQWLEDYAGDRPDGSRPTAAELSAWTFDDIIIDDGINTRRRRPGLELVRAGIRDNSIGRLVVVRLDRLGRSVRDLVDLSADMDRAGCELVSITEGIDTGTAGGRFLFHILAAVAQLEREMISDRTKAGMDAARRSGVLLGRPVAIPLDVENTIVALRRDGTSYPKICQALTVAGIEPPTGYRWHSSTVARVCKRRHV